MWVHRVWGPRVEAEQAEWDRWAENFLISGQDPSGTDGQIDSEVGCMTAASLWVHVEAQACCLNQYIAPNITNCHMCKNYSHHGSS